MEIVGKITHYYDSARMAVIEVLRDGFKIGDTLVIKNDTHAVEQKVEIMQLDRDQKPHEVAHAGEEVRVRVDQRGVSEGDEVYKKT